MVKQQTCLTHFRTKKRSSLSSKRNLSPKMCSLAKRMGVEKEFTKAVPQEQWIELITLKLVRTIQHC
ncbi:hypothetical protein O9993_10795 [Vibrio lentus]|nr:hypothetical protein [Vibrio lentus]